KRQLEQLKDDLRREADDSHRLLQPLDEAKIEALRQLDAVRFTELDEKRLELVSESVVEKAGKRKRLDELTILLRQVGDASARLEADAKKRKESQRQREVLRAELEIYDVLVNRVFHKRGVVMYAVDQLLPELEIEASKNLSELTDGRFGRIRLETYEEGRGH